MASGGPEVGRRDTGERSDSVSEVIRVYGVKSADFPNPEATVWMDNITDALGVVKELLSAEDQPADIALSVKQMDRAEYRTLPEFEG